ncbi:MAG: DNA-processing protein DprA, partial [Rubrobacteridae bacterium]|nr:DNA-processing protein DprA [Rubrobacteridae bacterium]
MKTDEKQALRDKQNKKYKKYWLGLKLSPELRNRLYVYVDRAGNPETLWKLNKDGLVAMGLKHDVAESFIAFRSSVDLEKEQERLRDARISLITDCDPEYPQQLKISPWHPKAIFYKGKPKQYEKGVAIVGSRKATSHGKTTAHELAHDLAKAGVAVISGG